MKKIGVVVFLIISLSSVAKTNLPLNKFPNVILILVDDLGYSDMGCYGNTLHETPNVDCLASQGMRFTNAYTACAVCSPTRASIQTDSIRFDLALPIGYSTIMGLKKLPVALSVWVTINSSVIIRRESGSCIT